MLIPIIAPEHNITASNARHLVFNMVIKADFITFILP